jgi:hypothetical protein
MRKLPDQIETEISEWAETGGFENPRAAAHEEYYKHGHRAACDLLIPICTELLNQREYLYKVAEKSFPFLWESEAVFDSKIRALLEAKETKE